MTKVKLGDAFTLQMGKTPSRNNLQYWGESTNKWVSISDLSSYDKYACDTKEHITDLAVEESGIKPVPKNTVIMSFKLSLGKTAITTGKTYTNEAIMAFIPNKNYQLDTTYLYYYLSNYNWNVGTNRAVMGATLNKNTLSNIEISIPSFPEQQQIADTLDKVSDLISKRKQQLEKLDLLIKSRFVEMFGDCKLNPKQWKTCELDDVANIGSSRRVFVEELKENGIPFYRGTEIGALAEGKSINPDFFITVEHYKKLCELSGTPQLGDLLMPSICPDGRIWIVNTEEPFYFKDGRVLWVHDIDKRFNSVYLLYTLKDRIMTDYSSIASGTTFAELKIFSLKRCKIFDVPLDLQNQFADFVTATEQQKEKVQKSLETLETLKASLMQKYFG